MTSADHSLKTRIALSMLKGINLSTAGRLLGLIDTPERFFELSESQLRMLTGLDSKATDDTQRARLLQLADKESDFVRTKSITTMFCGDSNYPARLSDCDDAPAMLYACGDREALDRPHLLSDVTRVLSDHGVNIISGSISTGTDRVATSQFSFEMADPQHLNTLLAAVRKIEGAFDVYRITGAKDSAEPRLRKM